jgi:uncharacterized protein YbjT (DUF2867 family)
LREIVLCPFEETRHRYVAVDDVAAGVAGWTIADDPPRLVEFGGPEGLTRNEAVDLFEQALGLPSNAAMCPTPPSRPAPHCCGGVSPIWPCDGSVALR